MKTLRIIIAVYSVIVSAANADSEEDLYLSYDTIVIGTYSKVKGKNDIVSIKIIKNAAGLDEKSIRQYFGKRRNSLLPQLHYQKLACFSTQGAMSRFTSYWVRKGLFSHSRDENLSLERLLKVAKDKQ
ncbi:hypothetical protein JIN77_16860 [Verrucomicrobiaceae bacterium R5-34]|nr:hypothetical protein [Verrucomicrobiaceae bacterium R5-34]